jgi:SapC
MVNMVAVSHERHGGKRWRSPGGYGFAATQALIPLVGPEFSSAAVAMPIAFVEHSGRYLPVAVLSPVQGRNFFIGPSGQWLGLYVPAALRSYPFGLSRIDGSDQVTLCIDEDSGCLVDAADSAAARLFEEDGNPSAAVKAAVDFLRQVEHSRAQTQAAVAALAEARLLQPWPLTVTLGKQQVTATGLYRIDEVALNAVSAETFLKLRSASALVLAYAQLISMHTTAAFGQMAMLQQHLAQQAKPLPAASSLFPSDDGGTIRFN